MIDEIEFHRKGAVSVRQRSCRKTTGCDLERDRPGMIQGGCLSERDFSDNLRPHVKGGVGIFPCIVRQGGPLLVDHEMMIRLHGLRASPAFVAPRSGAKKVARRGARSATRLVQ